MEAIWSGQSHSGGGMVVEEAPGPRKSDPNVTTNSTVYIVKNRELEKKEYNGYLPSNSSLISLILRLNSAWSSGAKKRRASREWRLLGDKPYRRRRTRVSLLRRKMSRGSRGIFLTAVKATLAARSNSLSEAEFQEESRCDPMRSSTTVSPDTNWRTLPIRPQHSIVIPNSSAA
jgi:hypothetical protein